MWKFQRGSQKWLGGNSSQIKDLPLPFPGTGRLKRDPRIWKLQPATPDAGFRIVYKDGSNDRYVPRWADLEEALLLSGNQTDDFKKANVITSVFLLPDVIGRVESDKGFLFEEVEGDYRVYLHPYREWAITKEWVPANEESSWMANQNEQYLRKLLDDYETCGTLRGKKVVADQSGGPSAWVWNDASPRRWDNINLTGNEWAVVLDQEGEKRMEENLRGYNYFHAAINRKAFPD
jgi:hypothetical protein